VVTDKRNEYLGDIVTGDGAMTRQEYFDQKRRILGNMGDAGVVDCLWTVCRYHSTNVPLQAKLLDIVYEMTKSRSVHRVKNILKTPGNMLVLETILMDTDIGLPGGRQNILFLNSAANYVSLVSTMFNADPVFTAEEEGRVVDAVYDFIARCFRNRCMTYVMLIPLLTVVSDRVRTSTLRKLTDVQIEVFCSEDCVRHMPTTQRQVSTLLHRALAANDIYDTSGIHPMFQLPHM